MSSGARRSRKIPVGKITVESEELEPGEHGVHVHEAGECGLPKFESAGKHFNPGKTNHGLKN